MLMKRRRSSIQHLLFEVDEKENEGDDRQRFEIRPPCCFCMSCFCQSSSCLLTSCADIISILLCRSCVPSKTRRTSWNYFFELSVKLVRNLFFHLQPNVSTIRMITDNALPLWCPVYPSGIVVAEGKYMDDDIPLKSIEYEWIYPVEDGHPRLMLNGDLSTISLSKRLFILYFHGGAFCLCCPASHRMLLCNISKAVDSTILSINYRRAPEFPHPFPGLDCFDAYKSLLSKVDPSQIILAGDSAGGSLVVETLIRCRKENVPLPCAGILLSPWVDIFDESTDSLTSNSHFDIVSPLIGKHCAEMYASPADDPSVLHQDLEGLPPLLVEIGECELLRDQILSFVDKAKSAGNKVECNLYADMTHVFQLFSSTGMKTCNQSFENMKKFVDEVRNVGSRDNV